MASSTPTRGWLTAIGRFFAAWATMWVAVVGAICLLGGVLEVLGLFTGGFPGWGFYERPMGQAYIWSVGGTVMTFLVGPVFVLFRRFIVQPRWPFLRWGYLAVMAAPFVAGAVLFRAPFEAIWLGVVAQPPLIVAALIYVALARWFGLFRPHAVEARVVEQPT